MSTHTISVNHSTGSYDVRVGAGLLLTLPDGISSLAPNAKRVALIADTGIPGTIRHGVRASLGARLETHVFEITPTEPDKSLATFESLHAQIAAASLERSDLVIALGGGVVGDLAGFVAATYRRGIRVIQCPTTLLAMVDASVGGKTGVNLGVSGLGLLKNAVGSFHQPIAVLADTDTLASLDDRTYRSGLAECVKHAMIAGDWDDPDLFEWTESHATEIAGRDLETVTELIARNIAVKARVVAADEREDTSKTKGRALLNLGHTFAHAIEPLPGLAEDGGPLEHGEAVGLGLIAATATASSLGWVPTEQTDRIRGLLAEFSLPCLCPKIPPPGELIKRMTHDKKANAGVLRVVLPRTLTRCETTNTPQNTHVEAGWASISGF